MIKRVVIFLLVLLLLSLGLSACSRSDVPLPRSLKGYELYSWELDSGWHFTLITGTNRNKTFEEITSPGNTVSEDGWVKIHVIGVEAVKAVLNRVPESEFVSWNEGQFVLPTEQAIVKLVLPPEEIVDEIKGHAEQCGLDFMVWGSW